MNAVKSYFLFKWRIWSVVTTIAEEDTEEIDEDTEEEGTAPLDASVTLSANDKPQFGFTPWSTNDTAAWLWEEE